MKKAFLLLFAGSVVFASCLKNDSSPACQDQDPSKEDASMYAFALTQGMTPIKDTLGIYYQIIDPGTSPKVSSMYDTVAMKYEGKLMNGTTFDKSDSLGPKLSNGQPLLAGGFIYGFWTSLQKIGKGGRIKMVIPSYVGYGCNAQGSIPGNSSLYFDVTLLDLKKKQ